MDPTTAVVSSVDPFSTTMISSSADSSRPSASSVPGSTCAPFRDGMTIDRPRRAAACPTGNLSERCRRSSTRTYDGSVL